MTSDGVGSAGTTARLVKVMVSSLDLVELAVCACPDMAVRGAGSVTADQCSATVKAARVRRVVAGDTAGGEGRDDQAGRDDQRSHALPPVPAGADDDHAAVCEMIVSRHGPHAVQCVVTSPSAHR